MAVAERKRKTLIGAGIAGFALALLGLVVFLILVLSRASGQISTLNAGRTIELALKLFF